MSARVDSPSMSWSMDPVDDSAPAQHPSIEEDISEVEISLESFGSVMTVEDLRLIRGSCFIPGEFRTELAGPQGRVHNPLVGLLGMYEEAMKADLHFPLHPFIVKLLDRYDLNLA